MFAATANGHDSGLVFDTILFDRDDRINTNKEGDNGMESVVREYGLDDYVHELTSCQCGATLEE